MDVYFIETISKREVKHVFCADCLLHDLLPCFIGDITRVLYCFIYKTFMISFVNYRQYVHKYC